METTMHRKIIDAKQKSAPITYSIISIDKQGKLNTSNLDKGIVEGYAIIWGERSLTGYKFLKGCCARSIAEHGPGSNAPFEIKFFNEHDPCEVMSLFADLKEDGVGLRFKTKPLDLWDLSGSEAHKLITQLKSKTKNNFSHGFDFIWDKTEYDETDDSLVAAEIQLYEISAVSIPAGMNTRQVQSLEQLGDLQEDISTFINKLPSKFRMNARHLFAVQHTLINTNGFGETIQEIKKVKRKQVKNTIGNDLKYLLEKF